MAAASTIHSEQGMRVSFVVCKPQEGCHIDDVVDHMVAAAASIEKCRSSRSDITISILRSISGNWVAAVAEKKGEEDANPWFNLPEAAAFTKGLSSVVRVVDSGWFKMNCEESKTRFSASGQKRVGDVVSVRRIYSGDGKSILGLGKWESVDTAYTAVGKPNGCSAEAFWRSLGAKKLKYDVCRVVYVSKKE